MIAFRCLLCALLCLLPAAFARADTPPDLLTPDGWLLATPHPEDAALTTAAEGTLRVTVRKPSTPFYTIQLVRGLPANIPAGHRVSLHFRARSATANPLRVALEKNAAPYTAIADLTLLLTPQWQEKTIVGPTPGYGPGGLSAHFQMGQQAGTVELADITATDLGPDPAQAAARAALAPARVQARIEKYRKGTLTVQVTDANGRPLPEARITLTQTRSAFLFGSNIFGLSPADTSAAQTAYQTRFTALFNYATLPFYWGAFEPTQGKPDYARLQAMAHWCAAHGVTPKGHPLVWHQVWPSWAPSAPDAAIPLLHARVADLVPRFSDTIHYWDVVNEASSGAPGQTPPNGESRWVVEGGAVSVVETALGWARAAGKGHGETFLYNDYDTGEANLALLGQMQKDGKLPDAIGIQSHMHSGVWPLEKVWSVCEAFSRFGKPIHFTETTILSGPRRDGTDLNGPAATDWNTTPEGEAAQAASVTQFYTVLFSHPKVQAITWWDLSDKDAWGGAPAGLLRRDMTPKPAYTALMALIHGQWWTRAAGKSDIKGRFTRRVFYGDYTVSVTDHTGRTHTQTVTFPEAAPPRTVTLHLPS